MELVRTMSLLTGAGERGESSEEQSSPSIRRHLRDVIVIAGLVGVSYVVMRYLESRENGRPLPEAISDRVEDATSIENVTDAEPIQIDVPDRDAETDDAEPHPGGTESNADESVSDPDSERGEAEAPADEVTDDETAVDLTDEERSIEEIEERTESDVQEEPAEPGEMAVDEAVADELTDDANDEDGGESNDV